jgi:hypothetical protein
MENNPPKRKALKIHFEKVFQAHRKTMIVSIRPKTIIPERLSNGKWRNIKNTMIPMEMLFLAFV